MYRKSAAFVHACRVFYFGDRVSFAHCEPFVINRTQAFFCYVFAGKNKVPVFVFSFYIKPFVCGVNKLHYFKFFGSISIVTVHVIAAFSAFFTFTRDFVLEFFGYKIRQNFVINRFYKIPHTNILHYFRIFCISNNAVYVGIIRTCEFFSTESIV